MVYPELKSLISPDLEAGVLPSDPVCCDVFLEAVIGPRGEEGGDIFSFRAVTPRKLLELGETRWGRGLLVVDSFNLLQVEELVVRLLSHCSGQDWHEAAAKLNRVLDWEFENYSA